jgi:peptidoglycan/LPS O-acetylase OafA/YrhL
MISLSIFALIIGFDAHLIVKSYLKSIPGFWRLELSQRFVTDTVLAIAFAMHLIAVKNLFFTSGWFTSLLRAFGQHASKLAKYSFSIYLYQSPIMNILITSFDCPKDSALFALGFLLVVLMLCSGLGYFTEGKQAFWKGMLGKLWPLRDHKTKSLS